MSNESSATTPQHDFFYYDALSDEEKMIYEQARDINNFDHEILLLRIKINQVLQNEPLNVAFLFGLVVIHNRMLKTNRGLLGGSLSPFGSRPDESLAYYLKRLKRDTGP